MGTTTGGLPYPEPSDPIANGANAIKDLANAIDPTLTGKVAKAGDTMTGPLVIDPASGVPLRVSAPAGSPALRASNTNGNPALEFWDDALSARVGYVQGLTPAAGGAAVYVTADAGGEIHLRVGTADKIVCDSSGAVVLNGGSLQLQTAAVERVRVDNAGNVLVGKTATDLAIAGIELRSGSDAITATTDTAAVPALQINHIGGSDAATQPFEYFKRTASGTLIGSITQVSTTGVAFNTTSHGPWKGEVAARAGTDALADVASWPVVSFRWKLDAAGSPAENGTPSGDVEVGFIAQDLAAVAPYAVAPGHGSQADHDAWLADPIGPDPFVPWGVDNARLVPNLVAAVQSLAAQVETLTARVAVLEAAP